MSRLVKRSVLGALVATAAGLMAITHTGQEEGLRLKAYKDIVGVPTACYGETKNIKMGMSFTKAQCDEMLLKRLDEFGTKVETCVKRPMKDRTMVAFTSLAYNVGSGGFCGSTVVRRYNAGDHKGACDAMLMWNKAGGRVVKGLTNRRERERKMCLADIG
ncbi:lysozyme [Methylobacterium sp. AMS5]|uniref:lysozyme n=1 Tax=Methylobacterium sp. AMS5 TaxID=925818 RepID=UPI00074FA936|nr:lysozyme [Methylobacterium sp. AMS5]AMB48250.1 glycosyl hydrolase [Methylobacterium sp. AMS5]